MKTIHNEKLNKYIVTIFFYATLIVDLLRKVNDIFIHQSPLFVELFRNSIYLFVFMYVIYHAISNEFLYSIAIPTLVFLTIAIISFIISPEIQLLLVETTLVFFTRCLCGFYIGYHMFNSEEILTVMQKFSLIAVIYAVLIFMFNHKIDMFNSYMMISNNLLLPFLAVLFGVVIQKKFQYILTVVILISTIVLYGARSPLLSIIFVCTILFFIYYKIMNIYKKIIFLIISSGSTILLFLTFDIIIAKLLQLFPGSRSVILLSQGKLLSFEGRDIIYINAIKILIKEPFKIRGILSDRFIVSSFLNVEASSGTYVHNILIELCLQYGLILGIIVISYILLLTLNVFIILTKSNKVENKILFSIFTGVTATSLMVSGSYITEYLFWIFLGYILLIRGFKRRSIYASTNISRQLPLRYDFVKNKHKNGKEL